MKISIHTDPITNLKIDALAWPVTSDLEFPNDLKNAVGSLLGELTASGETKGQAAELTIIHSSQNEPIRNHYLVGVGDTLDAGTMFRAAGHAVRASVKRGCKSLAIHVPETSLVRAAIEGALYGSYQNTAYKQNDAHELEQLVICGTGDAAAGSTTGQAVNLTRELVNTPANDLGPEEFAECARTEGEAAGLEVDIHLGHTGGHIKIRVKLKAAFTLGRV